MLRFFLQEGTGKHSGLARVFTDVLPGKTSNARNTSVTTVNSTIITFFFFFYDKNIIIYGLYKMENRDENFACQKFDISSFVSKILRARDYTERG